MRSPNLSAIRQVARQHAGAARVGEIQSIESGMQFSRIDMLDAPKTIAESAPCVPCDHVSTVVFKSFLPLVGHWVSSRKSARPHSMTVPNANSRMRISPREDRVAQSRPSTWPSSRQPGVEATRLTSPLGLQRAILQASACTGPRWKSIPRSASARPNCFAQRSRR